MAMVTLLPSFLALVEDYAPAPDDAPVEPKEVIKEEYHALAILTLMSLLGFALTLGQFLERNKITWMSEAGAALIVGIVLGLIVALSNGLNYDYYSLFSFDTDMFFLFLLPPIIFDAGFNLDVKPFFDNMGGIAMLAFVGTGISTAVIATLMWLLGVAGVTYPLPFFHSCLYGSIISATDPVTVLAVFGKLNADANLNALVFGESVLNDAVAIVLYNVIYELGTNTGPITMLSLLAAGGSFVYIFVGSLLIGSAFALLGALLFRTKYFRSEHAPTEAGLVLIIAYCSFYLAEGLNLSGITSIMFCGIAMAKYVRPNLSGLGDERVGAFFRVIAYLAETFVFTYIGSALFSGSSAVLKLGMTWSFILLSLVALAVSRYLNVYPITAICNYLTPEEGRRIPETHKQMLWFSGLRGAMAFALANQARDSLTETGADEPATVILTATFFMVLITVLVNGGGTHFLLQRWELQQGSGQQMRSQELSPMLPNGRTAAWQGANAGSHSASHPGSPGAFGGTIIQSIHDYQRQGGLTRQFEQIDRAMTDYFVSSSTGVPESSVRCREGSEAIEEVARHASVRSNRPSPEAPYSGRGSPSPVIDEQ